MTKITAIPRTAEEITGVPGCTSFSGKGWAYSDSMDERARKNERIKLRKWQNDLNYDYIGAHYFWKASWLKEIEEETGRTWQIGDYLEVKRIKPLTQEREFKRLRIILSSRSSCFLLEEGASNRWKDPIEIEDIQKITEEEMKKMLGEDLFEYIIN